MEDEDKDEGEDEGEGEGEDGVGFAMWIQRGKMILVTTSKEISRESKYRNRNRVKANRKTERLKSDHLLGSPREFALASSPCKGCAASASSRSAVDRPGHQTRQFRVQVRMWDMSVSSLAMASWVL